MARILALSFVFATLAPPAFGTGPMDPATVTCKAYETSGHQDMVQLDAAFHQALKGDPKLGPLSESELGSTIDRACAAHPDATVVDALRGNN